MKRLSLSRTSSIDDLEPGEGDSVFDRAHPWDRIRGGIVSRRGGDLWVWFPGTTPAELKDEPFEIRLEDYPGRLSVNILIAAAFGRRTLDETAWYHDVRSRTVELLRDAVGRRLPLDDLLSRLGNEPDLVVDLISDVLRMMVTEGSAAVTVNSKAILYGFSDMAADACDRIDYLATFADELQVKSRRVDLLIRHTGTVGSYREEMLRALLRQIVPRRYEVSTGFIEHCSRQLDILVWDASRYVPLFREGDVVVVPRSAVRGVIEVKTTLDTHALDDAMHILWDTFRNSPNPVPVFKGIFAYERGYASDESVADRMRTFYRGIEPDGIVEHEHMFMFSGIDMVCVPRALLVREIYRLPDDLARHPQPHLTGVSSSWPGDTKTGLFLGGLLSYLDMSSPAKSEAIHLFDPLLSTMELRELGEIYESTWRPRLTNSAMSAVDADGARTYLRHVQEFKQGIRSAESITAGLKRAE